MKRGQRGYKKISFLVAVIFFSIIFVSFAYGFETEILLKDQVNFGSDGKCGRSSQDGGWLDNCNTNVFTGSGPGGCHRKIDEGISGCYFWQPDGSSKVIAESKVDLPNEGNGSFGKLIVTTGNYGGGTYDNEAVNVFVNDVKIGHTDDNWCNLGDDCFNEQECNACSQRGPFTKEFDDIFFKKGTNKINFKAVNNGGSVTVAKYSIDAEITECTPGQTQSQACGNCGTQTRTCQSNGQWGGFGSCTNQGPCTPGQTEAQSCNTGLPGVCSPGTQTRTCQSSCQWSNFGTCNQNVQPGQETCNGLDDDCDNAEDEICSTCISNTIPSSMAPGQVQQVNITVRNDGSVPWTRTANYKLGSQNPQDNSIWNIQRVLINSGVSVNEGQQYTFNFSITAPSIPGTYHNEWRMLKEFEFWFLPPNCGHDVIVQGECTPGQTQSQACGNCGTQTRICQSNGQWGGFGSCTNQGPCSPGQTEAQSCNTGLPGVCSPGTQTRTCQSSCQWSNFGTCNQNVQPGQETCNGLDDDCDNQIDENITIACGGGLCSGIRTCANGQFGDCSSFGNICNTIDCDIFDTLCRNFNDVNAFCSNNGVCGSATCNNFVNEPQDTICGNSVNEFGCPWGNNAGNDTGIRTHELNCNGQGSCIEAINPWQVDEDCNINQFCFWDGLDNGDENFFCKQLCPNEGEDCTVGIGACQRDGHIICNPLGIPVCDAQPGNPMPEICNGIDDNCNGLIDDGINCNLECNPGENQTIDCGITNVGICQLGKQTRLCSNDGFWMPFGDCIGAINPQTEICNGLDDDCDGLIDENNVCVTCNLNSISIRGEGGNIEYIDGFDNIDNQDIRFSAWFRHSNSGSNSGILSINLIGTVNGEQIRLTTKGKVREVFENDCSVLQVDNSYWSLATYQEPGHGPISITFDSIVYKWDRTNNLLDIYGTGPFLNFNVTGISISQ